MIDYVTNIKNSKLTIYDKVSTSDADLYIPTDELQRILNESLSGLSLSGLALRTRSKVVKIKICEALGYPIPNSFVKTQPRFPGQNFDVYTQKSLNVQIWNEEVEPERRYVFIRATEDDVVRCVKIITGEQLATYDNTGTLTHKYQATMASRQKNVLFSAHDTEKIDTWITSSPDTLKVAEQLATYDSTGTPTHEHQAIMTSRQKIVHFSAYVTEKVDTRLTYRSDILKDVNPNSKPKQNQLLRIASVYSKLLPMVGKTIDYLDAVQERNRGAELHKMICQHLGYSTYKDDGTYPDLLNQLIEIKLQTSPTIDLGLHSPEDGAEVVSASGITFNSEDIRYVIFDGKVQHDKILLKHLYVVSGKDFTEHFPLFKGKGTNSKLQLPLPINFFD